MSVPGLTRAIGERFCLIYLVKRKAFFLKSVLSLSCVFPLQVFQWQLFSQQPPVFRAGRCSVVRTWQGQTWNPGLRPSCRAQKSPIALSYCLSTVPHYYPSTTNNLILKALQNPCSDWTANWTRASLLPKSCPPSISTPLYYTPPSQLSWTGTHSLGSDKSWFHRTDWEVPPQLLNCCPAAPFLYSPSAHKHGAMGEAWWEESTDKISNI